MCIFSFSFSICVWKKRTRRAISSTRRISPTNERWKGLTSGFNYGTVSPMSDAPRDRAHVLKLDVAKFTEFGNGIVSDFSRHDELHQAHRLGAWYRVSTDADVYEPFTHEKATGSRPPSRPHSRSLSSRR